MVTVFREDVDGRKTVVCRKPTQEAIALCRKLAAIARYNGSNSHYFIG